MGEFYIKITVKPILYNTIMINTFHYIIYKNIIIFKQKIISYCKLQSFIYNGYQSWL